MSKLTLPKERDYGWELKPTSSTYFGQVQSKSNQNCVVLEHSLLRGVTTEMIYWWFQHFPNMWVTLDDTPGYKGQKVPAYFLWHPYDHVNAWLTGKLGPDNTSIPGAKINIQEAMYTKKYGLKYPVNDALEIFYCTKDGWAMGKKVPFLGLMMVLRISFKDVYEKGLIKGVHYHYEIVVGTHKKNLLAKAINKKLSKKFGPDFLDAWHTHNTIEVGVFENFLPAIYAQRDQLNDIHYAKAMNTIQESPAKQKGFSQQLFEERMKGFEQSTNAFEYLQFAEASFL